MADSPWIEQDGFAVRYTEEQGQLVKKSRQINREAILEQNKRDANNVTQGIRPRDLSFGRYLGSVPMQDILRWQKSHPELFSPDQEIARKALIKFWNSSEGRPYRVQRA